MCGANSFLAVNLECYTSTSRSPLKICSMGKVAIYARYRRLIRYTQQTKQIGIKNNGARRREVEMQIKLLFSWIRPFRLRPRGWGRWFSHLPKLHSITSHRLDILTGAPCETEAICSTWQTIIVVIFVIFILVPGSLYI